MRVPQFITGCAIALSAFLLFAIEPLSSKELLPRMGGSSAVWLTCLCFFQIGLLVGYGYAAILTSMCSQRVACVVHLVALAAALLWIVHDVHDGVGAWNDLGEGDPTATIFLLLTRRLGLSFVLLSASSPLLQVFLARASGERVRFNLFALSNVGSLLALATYPTIVEPHLPLHVQRVAWAWGFAVYTVLCGWLMVRQIAVEHADEVLEGRREAGCGRGDARRVWLPLLLSAVGAVQLCAVTSHLTENVAALPLLWVIPLAAYLLSFAVAFEAPGLYRRGVVLRLTVVMLASLGYLLSKTDVSLPMGVAIPFFLLEMFLACWFCHAELYQLRPERPSEAANFYLLLAAGGAGGTALAVVVAPLVFSANYDLPVAFAMTAGVATVVTWREGWSPRMLWGTATALCLLLAGRLQVAYARNAMVLERNFYGSLRVKRSDLPPQAESARLLLHGTIEHGMQWFAPSFRREPLTYYGRDSGVGLALARCCEGRQRRIGVIGLGAGTLAAYGRPGDTMRFFEINPAVEQIAKEVFTYLRESKAAVTIVNGDARQTLERETSGSFDVLVVDAFSGDAIPVHLLTLEAVRLYERHLKPGGVLAFHISNQYLNLAPVLGSLAAQEGLKARVVESPGDAARGIFAARWVLLARADSPVLAGADGGPGEPLDRSSLPVWTDDYSSLLPLVRWGGSAP